MSSLKLQSSDLVRCIGCGGLVPSIDGPVHRYIGSSPGCWAIYGEVLAREYSDPALMMVHRQTVDAYAAQHPGHPSPQSIRSVGIHLVRICLMVERGLDDEAAARAMPVILESKETFHWLVPPANIGAITAVDVWKTESRKDHVEAVRKWAGSVWQAWTPHHDQVRRWVPAELRPRG